MRNGVTYDIASLSPLPGYVSVSQAADLLGVTRPTVMDYAYLGVLGTVYRLGGELDGVESQRENRPVMAISEAAIVAFKEKLPAHEPGRASGPLVLQRTQWRQRVVAWAQETGWDKLAIKNIGLLPTLLMWDYVTAFPADPYPIPAPASDGIAAP